MPYKALLLGSARLGVGCQHESGSSLALPATPGAAGGNAVLVFALADERRRRSSCVVATFRLVSSGRA